MGLRVWWKPVVLVRRLVFVLVAGVIAGTAAGAGAPDPLLQSAIGPSPTEAFHLAEVLRRTGRSVEADALERYLLRAHVDELAGAAHDPALRVEQAIALGDALRPAPQDGDFRARWNAALARRLAPVPVAADAPLPAELVRDRAALVALAPGLWALTRDGRAQRLHLLVALTNTGSVPVPVLSRFGMKLSLAPTAPAQDFTCEGELDRELAPLWPGKRVQYLCRAPYAGPAELKVAAWPQPLAAPAQVVFAGLGDPRAVADYARGLAERHADRIDALVRSAAPAAPVAQAGRGPEAKPAAPVQARQPADRTAKAEAAPGASSKGSWFQRNRDALVLLGKIVVVTIGYFGFAALIGNTPTAVLFWLMLSGLFVSSCSEARDFVNERSWLSFVGAVLYLIGFGFCALAAALLHTVVGLVTADRGDLEREGRHAVVTIFVTLVETLIRILAGLIARVFGRA